MTDQKFLDLGGQEATTLIGTSAALRGTDGGICSECQKLSATLINGKCPKHATLETDEATKQPDLLGNGAAQKKKGGCWTPVKR